MKNNFYVKLTLIFVLTFFAQKLHGQSEQPKINVSSMSFPTNIATENFHRLKDFEDKIVAFDGVIDRIERSRDKPFYRLRIGSSYLWTGLLFNDNINKVGDQIRVVGYLVVAEPNESEKRYFEGKYMVIAFGLVDFKNENFLFVSESMAGHQRTEWLEGKIPTAK